MHVRGAYPRRAGRGGEHGRTRESGRVEARAFQKGRDRGGRGGVMGSCAVRVSLRFDSAFPCFRGDSTFGCRQQGGSRRACAPDPESVPDRACVIRSEQRVKSEQASGRASRQSGCKTGAVVVVQLFEYATESSNMRRQHNKEGKKGRKGTIAQRPCGELKTGNPHHSRAAKSTVSSSASTRPAAPCSAGS